MLLRSRTWVAFSLVQLLGLGCFWLWRHSFSAVSSYLWDSGFIVLFPGDILGAGIIEKLFWRSRLSSLSLGLMSLALLVAINACCWVVVALMIGAVRRRVRSAKVE